MVRLLEDNFRDHLRSRSQLHGLTSSSIEREDVQIRIAAHYFPAYVVGAAGQPLTAMFVSAPSAWPALISEIFDMLSRCADVRSIAEADLATEPQPGNGLGGGSPVALVGMALRLVAPFVTHVILMSGRKLRACLSIAFVRMLVYRDLARSVC
jgi:hypothetical protein